MRWYSDIVAISLGEVGLGIAEHISAYVIVLYMLGYIKHTIHIYRISYTRPTLYFCGLSPVYFKLIIQDYFTGSDATMRLPVKCPATLGNMGKYICLDYSCLLRLGDCVPDITISIRLLCKNNKAIWHIKYATGFDSTFNCVPNFYHFGTMKWRSYRIEAEWRIYVSVS